MSTILSITADFHVKDDLDMNALMTKAYACDVELGNAAPVPETPAEIEQFLTGYTLAQAIQIVWHLEPEWVHRHVLNGWTMERVDGKAVWS